MLEMKESLKQIIMYGVVGAALMSGGNICQAVDGGATGGDSVGLQSSIIYDAYVEPANDPQLPDTPLLGENIFNTEARYVDLFCTGSFRYDQNGNGIDIEITGENDLEKVCMVKRDAAGRVVFNDPGAMCTISVPESRRARLLITLENIKSNFLNGEYHYLQLNQGGTEIDQLHGGDKWAECKLDHNSPISIYPRLNINASARGGDSRCEPVTVGALVGAYNDVWGENAVPETGEVDFGAVFRIKIECQPLPNV